MCDCNSECIWLFEELFVLFLLLGQVLDALVPSGFFDRAKLLELQIQSLVPLFCHVLPFVLHIDSGHLEVLASSELRNFLKILSQPD